YPYVVTDKYIQVGDAQSSERYVVFQMSGGFYLPSHECLLVKLERINEAEVFDAHDEALLSPNGNTLGIRLRYSMRFPSDGSYSPYPFLHPYANQGAVLSGDRLKDPIPNDEN